MPAAKRVSVRVPATSANLGPGFDAVGIALSLHNHVEAELTKTDGLQIEVTGEGRDDIPCDRTNLVWRAMESLFRLAGMSPPAGVSLRLTNRIPPASGLGSSAAAIVGGLIAAAGLAGLVVPMERLLALAAELDGHPDNVAAALVGGMVVVVPQRDGYRWIRLLPRTNLRVAVAMPELALPTKQSRGVLPDRVTHSDAAFNVGRTALLVAALAEGRFDLLSTAMQDRLHQDYRLPLLPGGPALLKLAMSEGWGISLSGSGPSLIALGAGEAPGVAMGASFAQAGVRCRVLNLRVDSRGAELDHDPLDCDRDDLDALDAPDDPCDPGDPHAPHHPDARGSSTGSRLPHARGPAGWQRGRPLIVQKYGGSSVATPELIKQVAARIAAAREQGNDLVVVVSAMGDATDNLLALASTVARLPERRELDALIATGEQVSVALLAMALQDLGIDAISLSGMQLGIVTDGVYSRARISRVHTNNILAAISRGQVVIAAGFQGTGRDGHITTLGRGGSDATAVVLAAALEARACEIFTDVTGVYTADPRVVPQARLLSHVSYDEMSEMSGLGAKVLQLRSVELARRHHVRLVVRSSVEPGQGTAIDEVDVVDVDAMEETMEGALVRGVTHASGEAKIVLEGVPDVPGMAAAVFSALAGDNIRVDMIIQGRGRDGRNDIAFTVPEEDQEEALAACRDAVAHVGACRVTIETVAKVSLVGAGITQDVRIAAAMFETLAGLGINIEMISTSATRISCLIRPERAEDAVRALHARFVETRDSR
jgi:aspartate kinase